MEVAPLFLIDSLRQGWLTFASTLYDLTLCGILLYHIVYEFVNSFLKFYLSTVNRTGFMFFIVNTIVREDIHKVEFRDIDINEAKEMGAMALFGEKYGNKVRAIKFGDSIELCGGTHAASTGNIGMLKIMSESAVAAGVRRIEAVTGSQVEVVIEQLEDQLRAAKEFFENTPNLVNSISKMVRENEAYKKAMEEVDKERIVSLKKAVEEMSTEINGVKVFALQGSYRPDIVKEVAFRLHSEYKNAAMFAAFQTLDNKPSLLIMYSDDLVQAGANAGKDIKEVAKLVNGGGGGQNFLATAGGKNIDGLAAAMEKMLELISK